MVGFEEAMDAIAQGVEILGILTLVLGLAVALVRAGLALAGGRGGEEGYRSVRTLFGRGTLRGRGVCTGAVGAQAPAGTGVPGRRRHHQDRRRPAVAPERRGSRADRAHQDVPELLAGGRDRWPVAMAAGRARTGGIVAGVA